MYQFSSQKKKSLKKDEKYQNESGDTFIENLTTKSFFIHKIKISITNS